MNMSITDEPKIRDYHMTNRHSNQAHQFSQCCPQSPPQFRKLRFPIPTLNRVLKDKFHRLSIRIREETPKSSKILGSVTDRAQTFMVCSPPLDLDIPQKNIGLRALVRALERAKVGKNGHFWPTPASETGL